MSEFAVDAKERFEHLAKNMDSLGGVEPLAKPPFIAYFGSGAERFAVVADQKMIEVVHGDQSIKLSYSDAGLLMGMLEQCQATMKFHWPLGGVGGLLTPMPTPTFDQA